MSWRRGEVWLDADVLWFREAVAAPAFPGIGPRAIPSLAPPPGLVASRVRRAAWERRRHLRRARTTAVALSPAVVLALAALRSGSGPEAASMLDDPPSLTFRVGTGLPVAEGTTIGPPPGRETAASRRRKAAAKAKAAPTIAWHHGVSSGLPWSGSLADGTQLPLEGPNWVTWNPVTDSVPNAPKRLYGTEHTIRTIVSVAAAYRAAHPDAPRIVVGDISREGGGPMTDEHVSHQNGLDADIYFPRLDHRLEAPVSHDQIDRRLSQDLVDRFVAAGAQMIFVGYGTDLRGPSGVVIPYAGHDYHLHVRFPPPGG
jgi:hypothetical protein